MSRTKVLIVDDEAEFASALAERLQLRDYDARAVYSADDGFESISADVPDVILLDLKMPGIKGIEALKTIKLAHPMIEVIILSGLRSEKSASEGLKNGAFDYVVKPVEIEDLVIKIDQAKDKKDRK
jgi:DNA-binding NtrC family response regulator